MERNEQIEFEQTLIATQYAIIWVKSVCNTNTYDYIELCRFLKFTK
jgi:hypothetical protein